MKLKGRNILIVLILVYLLGTSPAMAQGSDSYYFKETGHYVSGPFWIKYQRENNAATLYGYPITEGFTSKDGVYVQYFQRARFELNGQQVVVSPLGSLTYHPGPQLNINNPFACRVFSQTGFPVCFAFLSYYDKFGGMEAFGNPISPFEYQNGRIVQYFEKARMEWDTTRPSGQRVVLTNLGEIYFKQSGEDPARLSPITGEHRGGQTLENLHAFVWKSAVRVHDTQRIYVTIRDQTETPIADASVEATIIWPSGDSSVYTFATPDSGIAILTFVIPEATPGQVQVRINVNKGSLSGKTQTSFTIWY